MGGQIFVGIRKPNGEIVLSERWTNPMPYWSSEPSFLDGKGKEFVRVTTDLDRDDGPTREKSVHPSEYGVVFFDFKTKKIFSRNVYAGPCHFVVSQSHDVDSWRQLFDMNNANAIDKIEKLSSGVKLNVKQRKKLMKSFIVACSGQTEAISIGTYEVGDYFVKPPMGVYKVYAKIKGWKYNHRNIRAIQCWQEVKDWLKENKWKCKVDEIELEEEI